MHSENNKILLAAGCFWGVEQAFYETPGVVETRVGYCGGHTDDPTYEDVSSPSTGHVETVVVTYDPKKVNVGQLLDVFFSIHDPTQVGGVGPDIGSNYRSVIFYFDEEQKMVALNYKKRLAESGQYNKPIITAIILAEKFWPAEEYHQKYFLKHKNFVCPR
jgi:peptide-methionine (S)-S-oxide reductase